MSGTEGNGQMKQYTLGEQTECLWGLRYGAEQSGGTHERKREEGASWKETNGEI